MSSFVFALSGTFFTFLMTALGAAVVFLMRWGVSARAQRLCLGFAGGVMSAASVFSLILPAMEQIAADSPAWLMIAGGFACGAAAIALLDERLRAAKTKQTDDAARRRTLLFSAITLHNIPEGMAVGLAFFLAAEGDARGLAAACVLALGIGIQNLPEGSAISLPLRQSGMSRMRSFLLGAASGAVEPAAGLFAVLFAAWLQPVLPFLMAFAAGAMMLVTVTEMFPAAAVRRDGAVAAMAGYLLMMALDIAFV